MVSYNHQVPTRAISNCNHGNVIILGCHDDLPLLVALLPLLAEVKWWCCYHGNQRGDHRNNRRNYGNLPLLVALLPLLAELGLMLVLEAGLFFFLKDVELPYLRESLLSS